MDNTVIIIKNKLDANYPKKTRENLRKVKESLAESSYKIYECKDIDSENLSEYKDKEAYLLFVSYRQQGIIETKKDKIENTQIESIYVGNAKVMDCESNQNQKSNIKYVICKEITNKKVMINLLDGIDINISDDFDNKSYVMVRSVQSFADSVRDVLEKGLNPAGRSDYKMIDLTYELSDYAQKNQMCRRMYGSLEPDSMRSEYQRDRERIVNSKAFRRLVDKAQIFSAEKGDHYRTRMTHTLEVNQIAKAISMGLRLNLDLTEAIALAHDMGHTPFGHQGERTIRDILKGDKCVNLFNIKEEYYEKLGGFKHNYQGIRVLTKLEEKYAEHLGLDVCFQVLEGVLKHTKLKDAQIEEFINEKFIEELHINMDFCTNLEGQVVAIADEIAQRGHDIDDAINSGLLNVDELLDSLAANKFKSLNEMLKKEIDNVKKRQRHYISEKELVIGRIISCIVGYFINDVIENSKNELNRYSKDYSEGIFDEKLIAFSKPGKNCCDFLEKLINKRVIADSEVTRFDYNAEIIISKLFESYYKNPKLLHAGTLRKIYVDTMLHENAEVANSAIDLLNGNVDITRLEIEEITKKSIDDITNIEQEVIFEKRKILIRNIADYLAGMTDSYAMNEYQKIR